jgi:hypothetical protein
MAINIVLSMRKRHYLRLEHNIAKANALNVLDCCIYFIVYYITIIRRHTLCKSISIEYYRLYYIIGFILVQHFNRPFFLHECTHRHNYHFFFVLYSLPFRVRIGLKILFDQ